MAGLEPRTAVTEDQLTPATGQHFQYRERVTIVERELTVKSANGSTTANFHQAEKNSVTKNKTQRTISDYSVKLQELDKALTSIGRTVNVYELAMVFCRSPNECLLYINLMHSEPSPTRALNHFLLTQRPRSTPQARFVELLQGLQSANRFVNGAQQLQQVLRAPEFSSLITANQRPAITGTQIANSPQGSIPHPLLSTPFIFEHGRNKLPFKFCIQVITPLCAHLQTALKNNPSLNQCFQNPPQPVLKAMINVCQEYFGQDQDFRTLFTPTMRNISSLKQSLSLAVLYDNYKAFKLTPEQVLVALLLLEKQQETKLKTSEIELFQNHQKLINLAFQKLPTNLDQITEEQTGIVVLQLMISGMNQLNRTNYLMEPTASNYQAIPSKKAVAVHSPHSSQNKKVKDKEVQTEDIKPTVSVIKPVPKQTAKFKGPYHFAISQCLLSAEFKSQFFHIRSGFNTNSTPYELLTPDDRVIFTSSYTVPSQIANWLSTFLRNGTEAHCKTFYSIIESLINEYQLMAATLKESLDEQLTLYNAKQV
ncbi:MAG: hypothetical protein ACPGUD_01145 [Parashewanella sp.]